MPDGSSSAAPVMTPGPIDFNSDRIHPDGGSGATGFRASPLGSGRGKNTYLHFLHSASVFGFFRPSFT